MFCNVQMLKWDTGLWYSYAETFENLWAYLCYDLFFINSTRVKGSSVCVDKRTVEARKSVLMITTLREMFFLLYYCTEVRWKWCSHTR